MPKLLAVIVPKGFTDWLYLHESKWLLFYPDGVVRFRHKCDRTAIDRGIVICAPALMPEHIVTRNDKGEVTIEGSILCDDCGTHGFVREDKWADA